MRNFSIIPNSSQSAIDQYSDFLTREIYMNMQPYDANDPLFLQQLGVLQAEGIRRAIHTNSAVTHENFQGTRAAIADSANFIGNKIGSVANMLTSSLDRGFTALNNSLIKIDSGIETANVHLSNINTGINTANAHLSGINAGVQNINNNLIALGKLVGQGFSVLYNRLSQSNKSLGQVLHELKIPETQRERRYHIEEGSKYLTLALQNGDDLYFDDAFDEFNTALTFEKKDWFSWFNIGLIHLRSKEHLNPQKAIDAFKRTVHYGQAEVVYAKNVSLEHKIDEAHLYMAELYYLLQDYPNAVRETEQCLHIKHKADFMKVKYLSATGESQCKRFATEILSGLIEQNPYITLQVIEDDDVLSNEHVICLLEEVRIEKNKEARVRLKEMDSINVTSIEERVSTGRFLDACEAISLCDIISETKKELKEIEKHILHIYEYMRDHYPEDSRKQENIIQILKCELKKIDDLISIEGDSKCNDAIQLAKQIEEKLDYYFYRNSYKDFRNVSALTVEYRDQQRAITNTKCSRILETNTPDWILDIAAIEDIVGEDKEKIPQIDVDGYHIGYEIKTTKMQLNKYIEKHKNATRRTLDIIRGCYTF